MIVTLIFHLIIFCIRCRKFMPSLKNCNWEAIINISFIDSFRPPRHFFLHFFVSVCNCDRVANKYKCKYFSLIKQQNTWQMWLCGRLQLNTTGWCQYLQLGYIVLCTSVNKTIIIIVTTTTTIIIIIIIVIKTGAPLLGLAKYIY